MGPLRHDYNKRFDHINCDYRKQLSIYHENNVCWSDDEDLTRSWVNERGQMCVSEVMKEINQRAQSIDEYCLSRSIVAFHSKIPFLSFSPFLPFSKSRWVSLSVYFFNFLIVPMFICVYVCVSVCVSVCLCICLSVYLSICLSVYLSVYLFIRIPIFPIYLAYWLYIYASVSLGTCRNIFFLFIWLSVFLPVCMSN